MFSNNRTRNENCKPRYLKRDLRLQFKTARHEFDKLYRKEERKYLKEKLLDIEKFSGSDPKSFWESIIVTLMTYLTRPKGLKNYI